MTQSPSRYFATLESNDGKVETVNGITWYEVNDCWFHAQCEGFEVYLSVYNYRSIEVKEGTL